MMRKITGLAVTALLLGAIAARPAAAQARGYVGFGGGLAFPTGDFKNCCKTGFLGQVIAGITGPSGVLGGRVDGMYIRNNVKSPGSGHSTHLGANVDVVWTPGKRPAKVHPYLLGGIGFFNSKFGTFDETKFAFNAGAGIQIHLGNRMDFFGEGRYLSVQTDGGSTNMIPFAIGLRWGGI